jgi:hypothetical protein
MTAPEKSDKQWDVFISHAIEDQAGFVRNLAAMLTRLGLKVWYAETALRVGQSLARSIDVGIAQSHFGIVVISPHFIAKRWPEYELRGLIVREIDEGNVILPIWHGVTKADVVTFSPSLADKFALNTAQDEASEIALKLLREIRPDIYQKHERSQLEKLASGEAMQELQKQIEDTRSELEQVQEELEQFQCPYCKAELTNRNDAPVDSEEKHWDVVESYACGYQVFGGEVQHPCPSDPRFPLWEDFELHFKEMKNDSHWKWSCVALGKTSMARRLSLPSGLGVTQEEAVAYIKERYDLYAKKRR